MLHWYHKRTKLKRGKGGKGHLDSVGYLEICLLRLTLYLLITIGGPPGACSERGTLTGSDTTGEVLGRWKKMG